MRRAETVLLGETLIQSSTSYVQLNQTHLGGGALSGVQ
jgi:hypothetical protein